MSELPKQWVITRVGDVIVDAISGAGFGKEYQGEKTGEYPFAKVGDISRHFRAGKQYIRIADHYVDEATRRKLRAKIFPENTIVFAKIGEALKNNYRVICARPMLFDNNVMGLVPEPMIIETKYLFYLLKISDFGKYSVATAVPSVRRGDVEAIEVPLPPINEQKRIVAKIEELFSELDKGIENLKTAREQLKVYRQAVLKHAFEGKLTADWREKNKNKLLDTANLLEQFDHSAVDDSLPDGWITAKFKCIYEASQNGLSKRSGKTGKNIPVLRLADITNHKIIKDDLRSILLDEKEEAKYSLTDNDLLAIRVNGSPNLVGRMIFAQGCDEMAYCDHFIRFRFDTSIILPEYVQHYFNTHVARRYIDLNKVSSAGQNTVSQATLGELYIPYCSLEEQKLLTDLLSETFANIDSLTKEVDEQVQKVEALRQSILKRAFSGRLVAQDPKDEPASVLLERIKAGKSSDQKKRKSAA